MLLHVLSIGNHAGIDFHHPVGFDSHRAVPFVNEMVPPSWRHDTSCVRLALRLFTMRFRWTRVNTGLKGGFVVDEASTLEG